MSKTNLLLQITNGIWLVEPIGVTDYGPRVRSAFERNPVLFNAEAKTPEVQIFDVKAGAIMPGYYSGFKDAPEGSIGVIDLRGVLLKEDNCGDPGTASLSMLSKQADANPNIVATIFRMDSPGGQVNGTENFANVISGMRKPKIGFVSGMMCSACYWIGSACDEIYISSQTDMVGSIGTMMSFEDAQPMWEKKGVVFHEIYATESVDKNKHSIEARKGKYDLVKDSILDPMNNAFLSAVKTNRGDKIDQKQTLSGKVFVGKDAISVGLVDGMKSFDETLVRAQQLANKSTNNNQSQSNMKLKASFKAMGAFLALAFSGFKAEETVLTEEHFEKIDAELATLEAVKKDKETAETALQTANADVTRLTDELATAKTTITKQEERIVELGKANPGASDTHKKDSDDTGKGKDDMQAVIDNLPHNKAIENDPRFNAPVKK